MKGAFMFEKKMEKLKF